MKKEFDLTDKLFDRWKVIKFSGTTSYSGDYTWLCECECGRQSVVKASYLRTGRSKQCLYCAKHHKDTYNPDELPLVIWNRIGWNAKRRKIPIQISKEYAYQIFLNQNKKCKLTGLDIRLPLYGTDKQWTASLDRIDGKKGYVKNNVQWIHKDVNRMKNIFDEPYFISICKKVSELNE